MLMLTSIPISMWITDVDRCHGPQPAFEGESLAVISCSTEPIMGSGAISPGPPARAPFHQHPVEIERRRASLVKAHSYLGPPCSLLFDAVLDSCTVPLRQVQPQ